MNERIHNEMARVTYKNSSLQSQASHTEVSEAETDCIGLSGVSLEHVQQAFSTNREAMGINS